MLKAVGQWGRRARRDGNPRPGKSPRACPCLYVSTKQGEAHPRAQVLISWAKEHFWWQSLAEWVQLAAGYTEGLALVPGSWDSPTFLPFANLRHHFLLLNTATRSVILQMKSQTGNEKLRVSWLYWGLYRGGSSLRRDLYLYETILRARQVWNGIVISSMV